MQHPQQQQENPLDDLRKAINILMFLAMIWGLPFEAILRKSGTWGSRYWGLHASLGLVPLFLVCLMSAPVNLEPIPYHGPWAVPGVFGVILLMALAQQVDGAVKRRKGYQAHSMYSGLSLIPGPEVFVKSVLEPAVLMAIGVGLLFVSVPVGVYLIGAGVCLSLIHSYYRSAELARQRAMQDARIMAEHDAQLMKEGRE